MTDDELNRAVAEKVMGWVSPSDDGSWRCWSPATSPDHAAMVMERMREEGWRIDMDDWDDVWSVTFDRRDIAETGDDRAGYAEADTWTRAVCLAALAAKEERVGN